MNAASWENVSVSNSHGVIKYHNDSHNSDAWTVDFSIGTTYTPWSSIDGLRFTNIGTYWSGSASWTKDLYYQATSHWIFTKLPSDFVLNNSIINCSAGTNAYPQKDVSCRFTNVEKSGTTLEFDLITTFTGNYTATRTINIGFSTDNYETYFLSDTTVKISSFSLQSSGSNNADIIGNLNQNTEDIISNQDKNTQDIIDSQDKINDNLTDETPPDTTGLADAPGWLPAGPVDSIATLPINLLQSLTNNLDSSCTPINLPIPFIDDNLTLDCPATLLKRFDGFWMFWEGFGLIAGVWILYKYFINLYKWVESHLSMDEKESLGKWGGI